MRKPSTRASPSKPTGRAPSSVPNIYGQFVEHLGRGVYEGIWVGADSPIPNTRGIRNDVVAALRQIRVPVMRWPGGCFAELYHWRDGIGPASSVARSQHRVGRRKSDTNQFGTHEFMDFVDQIGASPFISVNVGRVACRSGRVDAIHDGTGRHPGRATRRQWTRGAVDDAVHRCR